MNDVDKQNLAQLAGSGLICLLRTLKEKDDNKKVKYPASKEDGYVLFNSIESFVICAHEFLDFSEISIDPGIRPEEFEIDVALKWIDSLSPNQHREMFDFINKVGELGYLYYVAYEQTQILERWFVRIAGKKQAQKILKQIHSSINAIGMDASELLVHCSPLVKERIEQHLTRSKNQVLVSFENNIDLLSDVFLKQLKDVLMNSEWDTTLSLIDPQKALPWNANISNELIASHLNEYIELARGIKGCFFPKEQPENKTYQINKSVLSDFLRLARLALASVASLIVHYDRLNSLSVKDGVVFELMTKVGVSAFLASCKLMDPSSWNDKNNKLKDQLFTYLEDIQAYSRWICCGGGTNKIIEADLVASSISKTKRGRRNTPQKEEQKRLSILDDWQTASEAGIERKAFCADHNITIKEFEKYQAWSRQRKRRSNS